LDEPQVVDPTQPFHEAVLEFNRRDRNRSAAHIRHANRVEAGRCLTRTNKMSATSWCVEVLNGIRRQQPLIIASNAYEMILVDTRIDRSVPQRAPTDLRWITMAFDNEKVMSL
jgi:hypothetical protein